MTHLLDAADFYQMRPYSRLPLYTFGYIHNNELAKRAFRENGKTLLLPEIRETVDFEVA